MRRQFTLGILFAAIACGGSNDGITSPPKKPDPYVTIRIRNLLDTTTAIGRADWHVQLVLTGPNVSKNGLSNQGSISLQDVRLGHNFTCTFVGADSVGERLISVLAVADTTTEALTPDATALGIQEAWFAGDHTMPAGWAALFNPPVDAWVSQQFLEGHGLVPQDPIRWGLDWTGSGTVALYELPPSENVCDLYH